MTSPSELTVLVSLGDDLLKVLLGDLDAHHPQDDTDSLGVDGASALGVEGVEGLAEGCGEGGKLEECCYGRWRAQGVC